MTVSDRALGIRTARKERLDPRDGSPEAVAAASAYEPTPYGVLEEMLIGLDVPSSEVTFVDVGAGKGRVVCLAAGYPFGAVLGVELSARLTALARENVAQLEPSRRRSGPVTLRCEDARRMRFPDTPLVIYLYNPFGRGVFEAVIDRLAASLAARPRRAWVLYYEDVHADALSERGFEALRVEPGRFSVWRAGVAAGGAP